MLAAPPPAMTTRVQRKKGLTSVMKEAVTTLPATMAAGVASVSSK